ncbi:MAG: hypothetical protein FWF81_04885 [Defluviitaleaceae bacterium]|nr:hypothetical protein [Defluviitaleaceae bacterium]
MITKLEKPIWMTVEEADEKFFPDVYVITNCETRGGDIASGVVVAYAPMRNNGGVIYDLADELHKSGEHGEVYFRLTQDPLEGGSLLVEYCETD